MDNGEILIIPQMINTMESWTVSLKMALKRLGFSEILRLITAHLMDLGNNHWADYFALEIQPNFMQMELQ